MNLRGLVIFILALFLVGSTALVSRTSAADKTIVTGTETFDPFGLLGGGQIGDILSPGTVNCPGFEPTGDPLQPCPPGSRINFRDMKIRSRVESTDPRYTGWLTLTLNGNFDAASTGPVWGTSSIALDAGGTWDGTWQGMRVQEGGLWITPLHFSGQGTGGVVDGMQVLGVDRVVAPTPAAILYTGSVQARILDPHAK